MTTNIWDELKTEPKRDRYGRYLITPPDGGKPVGYTRVSTIAKTIDDRTALEKWMQRQVAKGLASSPELILAIQATEDKKELTNICEKALEVSKTSQRADIGTQYHALTERLDQGEKIFETLGEEVRKDLEAYREATKHFTHTHIEVGLVHDDFKICGTADRITQLNGEHYIFDLKTGTDLSYAWNSIAIQLALYANATHIYDFKTDTRIDKPDINLKTAYVAHLPAGEARCDIYEIDIEAGARLATLAINVREARKTKNIATPAVIQPAPPKPEINLCEEMYDWCLTEIKTFNPEQLAWAQAMRPAEMPRLTPNLTIEQYTQIADLIEQVETQFELPFPPKRPDRNSENQPVATSSYQQK